MAPLVKLDMANEERAVLQWHVIRKGTQNGGELLAACDLFLVCERPSLKLEDNNNFSHEENMQN